MYATSLPAEFANHCHTRMCKWLCSLNVLTFISLLCMYISDHSLWSTGAKLMVSWSVFAAHDKTRRTSDQSVARPVAAQDNTTQRNHGQKKSPCPKGHSDPQSRVRALKALFILISDKRFRPKWGNFNNEASSWYYDFHATYVWLFSAPKRSVAPHLTFQVGAATSLPERPCLYWSSA